MDRKTVNQLLDRRGKELAARRKEVKSKIKLMYGRNAKFADAVKARLGGLKYNSDYIRMVSHYYCICPGINTICDELLQTNPETWQGHAAKMIDINAAFAAHGILSRDSIANIIMEMFDAPVSMRRLGNVLNGSTVDIIMMTYLEAVVDELDKEEPI